MSLSNIELRNKAALLINGLKGIDLDALEAGLLSEDTLASLPLSLRERLLNADSTGLLPLLGDLQKSLALLPAARLQPLSL